MFLIPIQLFYHKIILNSITKWKKKIVDELIVSNKGRTLVICKFLDGRTTPDLLHIFFQFFWQGISISIQTLPTKSWDKNHKRNACTCNMNAKSTSAMQNEPNNGPLSSGINCSAIRINFWAAYQIKIWIRN